jgi:NAD(P)-dependent dehydrogenase (short-subunit alcohol dehydrogenase family)
MVDAGGGTFIVSGATASLRGGAKFSAFASAKFALRGLTQSLAREFQPAGIHVCHVILDGIIDTPRSRDLHGIDPKKMMKPTEIAETYWHLAHQPKSTWTHELDLRPASEGF